MNTRRDNRASIKTLCPEARIVRCIAISAARRARPAKIKVGMVTKRVIKIVLLEHDVVIKCIADTKAPVVFVRVLTEGTTGRLRPFELADPEFVAKLGQNLDETIRACVTQTFTPQLDWP